MSAATIVEVLERAARDRRDELAVADGDVLLTCGGLAARVRDLARGLVGAGVEHGDRVALWAPNSWQWIMTALAVHSVGGVLVPINTRFKPDEARHVIERSRAKLVFTVEEFLGARFGDAVGGITDWGRSLRRDDRTCHVDPDDVGDLMFTSGTTGRPKAVPATHAQSLRAFTDWAEIVGLRRGDRYLVVVPFFHTFGYKAGWMACLITGAVVLPQAVFDVDQVIDRCAREGVTVLPGPPTLYHSLLTRKFASSLRLAVTGAAHVPVELVKRMSSELGFETVLTGYGLTESTGVATLCRAGDDPETVATTSGRAMPGVEVRIADDGEILVRGYNVMRGYVDEPGDDTIDADGWLHTGDIGRLDARGNLSITDRKKDMFIVGGFNAYPAEIENVLLSHPAIAQVAVVGAPDPRLGEVGVAFVVARPGVTCDPDELGAWSRARMANYKVPRRFEIVPALPTNASGKVMKTELRRRVQAASPPR